MGNFHQLIKIAVRAVDNPVTINSTKLTMPTLYQMVQKSVCPCFCKVKPASVTYLWAEEDLLYLGMCQAFFTVAVAEPFLAAGTRFLE